MAVAEWCKEGKTGICLNVNPGRPGAAYGYVDMGGWVGGQAEYVMVPYADFNLLKFPDRDQAMAMIQGTLTLLSDIFSYGVPRSGDGRAWARARSSMWREADRLGWPARTVANCSARPA